jgi:hypothetical protein
MSKKDSNWAKKITHTSLSELSKIQMVICEKEIEAAAYRGESKCIVGLNGSFDIISTNLVGRGFQVEQMMGAIKIDW